MLWMVFSKAIVGFFLNVIFGFYLNKIEDINKISKRFNLDSL